MVSKLYFDSGIEDALNDGSMPTKPMFVFQNGFSSNLADSI